MPWVWGLTGIVVDTSLYQGDINTSAIFLDPPPELIGKINVAPDMIDVMFAAVKYLGGTWCDDDWEMLRRVADKLDEASASWTAVDYGIPGKFAGGDFGASIIGTAWRCGHVS